MVLGVSSRTEQGQLSNLRLVTGAFQIEFSATGSNTNLSATGRLHGLERYVVSNPSQWGVVSSGTMADTMEAILGALYLDGGIRSVKRVINTLGLGPV